jgi:hypothetical protein
VEYQALNANPTKDGMAFVASIARNNTGNNNWGMYRRDKSRPNEWSPCDYTNFSGEAVVSIGLTFHCEATY